MIEVVLYENNAVMGSLEVTDSGSFPLALTKSNSDIRDITKRQGAYSKDFEVLATVNNNRVLKYIYNANTTPIGFRDCAILSNGMPILEGKIFVTGIKQREAAEVYSLRVYSDNVDWYVLMRDKSIKDYDYGNTQVASFTMTNGQASGIVAASTTTSTLDRATIEASWQNEDKFDYVYPLISYGQPDNGQYVAETDMRPAIYLGKMLTKAFADVGYTMSSDFFSTGVGSRLILPYTGDNFTKSGLFDFEIKAGGDVTIYSTTYVPTVGTQQVYVTTRLIPNQIVSDPSGVYNNTTGVITLTEDGDYSFGLEVDIAFTSGGNQFTIGDASIRVRNINTLQEYVVLSSTSSLPLFIGATSPNTGTFTWSNQSTVQYFPVGQYELVLRHGYLGGGLLTVSLLNGSAITQQFQRNITTGRVYELSAVLNDIKVLDIISGLQNMFNLYFETSNYGRTVTIEPKKDLIKLPSQGIVYSQKLDINNRIKTNIVDSYARLLNFRFKDDNNDGWQKNYNSENGSIFGSTQYDLGDEFKDGSTTVGTKFFAATLTYNVHPFSNNGCAIPVMWKDNAPSPPKNYDFEPRVLYYKGYGTITLANSVTANWKWTDNTQSNGYVLLTNVPSSFMLDPDLSETTPVNILYGDKTNANGLARTYYNGDVAIIADRRVHTAYFRLTPTEFSNIDLFAPIYIDHVNLAGWYYINQVVDFKPEGNVTTVFELVKAFNELPFSRPIATEIPTIQGGRRQLSAMGGGTLTAGVKETFGSVVAHNGSGNVGIIRGGGTVLGNGNKQTASNQSILGNFNYGNDAIFTVGVGLDDDLRYNGLQFMPDGRVLAHGGNIYIRRYPTGAIELIDLKVRMTVNGSTVLDNIHLIGRNG
jgi:hypothetical protein